MNWHRTTERHTRGQAVPRWIGTFHGDDYRIERGLTFLDSKTGGFVKQLDLPAWAQWPCDELLS